MGAHHFDGHRCHRLGADAHRLRLEHSAERAGTQLLAELEPLSGKLVALFVRQQFGLLVERKVGIDALRIALVKLVPLAGAEEQLSSLAAKLKENNLE